MNKAKYEEIENKTQYMIKILLFFGFFFRTWEEYMEMGKTEVENKLYVTLADLFSTVFSIKILVE